MKAQSCYFRTYINNMSLNLKAQEGGEITLTVDTKY